MQDVSTLVAQAREGRPRAVARLISLVEGASPQRRGVMAARAPRTGGGGFPGRKRRHTRWPGARWRVLGRGATRRRPSTEAQPGAAGGSGLSKEISKVI